MKRLLFFAVAGIMSLSVQAQALRDINFSYLYSQDQPFKFTWKPVRSENAWSVYYELKLTDATALADAYYLQWDVRSALFDKQGTKLKTDSTALKGKIELNVSAAVQILVVKVIHKNAKQAWFYYQILDPKYPATAILKSHDEIILERYVKSDRPYTVAGESLKTVSYYNTVFPPATPVFSESVGKVSAGMRVDSTFTLIAGQTLDSLQEGLYLLQKDTSSAEGLAFRVQPDYPRYGKVENLADPLIYVCTKSEFDRIKAAKGDKKAFDRVILSITGDTERAKQFMRSYFRRVELANIFFTSYKEGWKTDRGMIYIIMGVPDEVFRFNDREVWNYKNESYKISFDFVKSPTLFDPENYVLIREKKFRETWYEVIDLWRNARF
ncbi:MAG TPA: GWxTD domain-containing protein [Ohtaekwangia sp.]